MKRTSFVRLFLTTLGLASGSLPAQSIAGERRRPGKGFHVASNEDRFGKPLSLFDGDKFYCKVSGSDTNGDLYIFESTRLKEGGPALHYHYDQDEWWFILSGEFLVRVGDKTWSAKAGDSVFGPRGIPHTFAKVGEGEAKLVMLFQPAGKMEKWFSMIADGTVGKMSEEERHRARMAHGFEHVGPPLTVLKKP